MVGALMDSLRNPGTFLTEQQNVRRIELKVGQTGRRSCCEEDKPGRTFIDRLEELIPACMPFDLCQIAIIHHRPAQRFTRQWEAAGLNNIDRGPKTGR